MKFSEVVTNDKCDVHAKVQGRGLSFIQFWSYSHSVKIQVFVQKVFFFNEQKNNMQIKVVNLRCDYSGDSVNWAQIAYAK